MERDTKNLSCLSFCKWHLVECASALLNFFPAAFLPDAGLMKGFIVLIPVPGYKCKLVFAGGLVRACSRPSVMSLVC